MSLLSVPSNVPAELLQSPTCVPSVSPFTMSLEKYYNSLLVPLPMYQVGDQQSDDHDPLLAMMQHIMKNYVMMKKMISPEDLRRLQSGVIAISVCLSLCPTHVPKLM